MIPKLPQLYCMNYLKIIVIACALFPLGLNAQSIIIRDRSGNIVNNDTLMYAPEFTQKPPYIEIQCYFFAQNSSAATMDMGVKKTELSIGANVEHAICFGKTCYQPSVFIAPVGETVVPGDSDSTFSGTYRYLPSTHTPANDLVAYTFYDRNDPSVSATVYVVYNTMSPTGVNETAAYSDNDVRTIPNPANDVVNFLYKPLAGTPATLIVVNAMGQLVANKTVNDGKGSFSLNTDQWSDGVYYYTISLIGSRSVKGCLMIAH